jgi:hypothetical protein
VVRLSFGLGRVGFWGGMSPAQAGLGRVAKKGFGVFIGLGRAQPRVAKNI